MTEGGKIMVHVVYVIPNIVSKKLQMLYCTPNCIHVMLLVLNLLTGPHTTPQCECQFGAEGHLGSHEGLQIVVQVELW